MGIPIDVEKVQSKSEYTAEIVQNDVSLGVFTITITYEMDVGIYTWNVGNAEPDQKEMMRTKKYAYAWKRAPAWADRILELTMDPLCVLDAINSISAEYKSYGFVSTSDHKPVSIAYKIGYIEQDLLQEKRNAQYKKVENVNTVEKTTTNHGESEAAAIERFKKLHKKHAGAKPALRKVHSTPVTEKAKRRWGSLFKRRSKTRRRVMERL